MCFGGHSLHRDDYARLALVAGASMLGFGAAGMGPAAGLFGGAAPGAVGAGAGAMVPGAELAGGAGVAGLGGGTAAAFGPTAAGSALLDTFAPGAVAAANATPTLGTIAGEALAGSSGAAMGMPELGASATAWQPGPLSGIGGSLRAAGRGLYMGQQAMGAANAMQPHAAPMATPAAPPPRAQGPSESFAQSHAGGAQAAEPVPGSPEWIRWMQDQQRARFAGLA